MAFFFMNARSLFATKATTPHIHMEFQRKIERVLALPLFGRGDVLILRLFLASVSSATDLQDALQWFHVAYSLLNTYAAVSCLSFTDLREDQRRYKACIARGLRKWFFAERPLFVQSSEREACMNRLMIYMGEELRQDERIAAFLDATMTSEVLLA